MVRRLLAVLMVLATLIGAAGTVHAQPPTEPEGQDQEVTPARLSYTAGAVSFWRPGAADWTPAQSNTPLAPGDELYSGHDGNLEVQVGGRAFIRGWGDTQLGLVNQDASFLQLRIGAGHVALDLHALDAGDVVEIDAPGAAFTINQPGYYRIDVDSERTSFATRRSGQATLTTATGPAGVVQAGEAVLVDGASVERVAPPEPDVWDRWNEARTTALVTTTSARYVPQQVYGASELDRYGTWRVEPTYGAVWIPASVPAGWAPYSAGRWIWDPRFGWTWIDTAPWGWAPYHYGRWVHVGSVWAWAPGPVVARPVYAPALVAFFGVPGVSVTVAGPSVGWVALSWGEPLVPWWGRPGFVGRPWWGGWGGPRVHDVAVYRNVTVVNAVVVVRSDQFGRRPVTEARIARPDVKRLEPVRGRLAVQPEPVSFTTGTGPARVRPPDAALARPVVSTRPVAPRPEAPRASDDKHDARRGPQPGGPSIDDRHDARRGPQPGARTDSRPDTREDARPGARTDTRPDPRRDAKPDVNAEPRREAPRGARPDGAPDRRPDGKGEARPEPRAPSGQNPAAAVTPPRPVTPPAKAVPPTIVPPTVAPPTVAPPATPSRPPAPSQAPAPGPGVGGSRPPETPRGEPRSEIRHPEVPRPEQRREPPRVDPQQQDPQKPDQRRLEGPRSEAPRAEPPRAETPLTAPPRRAAAHGADNGRGPEPGRVTPPEKLTPPAHGRGAGRPGAPEPEYARPER
jgi:hypothetical protein